VLTRRIEEYVHRRCSGCSHYAAMAQGKQR